MFLREIWLWFIVVAYLLIGTLYALLTPAWQTPDEPAHYNYVRQLANGRLPIIEAGDYDQAYLGEVVFGERPFAPEYDLTIIEYEDWQPPLYYLLQAPVFLLNSGSLQAMRLFSLLLGAGVILFGYGVARRLFPEQRWVGVTTAVFIAFIPQHVAMMAALNNDSLSELLIAAMLFVLVAWLTTDDERAMRALPLLGVLQGLGFLTKAHAYLMAPVIGLAILWHFRHNLHQMVRGALLFGLPAVGIGAVWWGRNLIVYGGLDFLGKQAHDAVVVGQPRTGEWIANNGLWETVGLFLQTTFNSFWGQFGWMTIVMPLWVRQGLLLLTAVSLLGWLGWLIFGKQSNARLKQTAFWLVLLFLFTFSAHAGYNLTFVQHQGRYLFPALLPIGLAFSVGLLAWTFLLKQWQAKLQPLVPLGLAIGLIGLNLLALFRFILPNLPA